MIHNFFKSFELNEKWENKGMKGALHFWKHIYENYSKIENWYGGVLTANINMLSEDFLHRLHDACTLWARELLGQYSYHMTTQISTGKRE
jgi:hypothetical protein